MRENARPYVGTPGSRGGFPQPSTRSDGIGGNPVEILGVPTPILVAGTRAQRALAIAAAQRNVVTRAQLRQAALTDAAIDRMVAAGLLHRIHPGVYAWGSAPLPQLGPETAALLAVGGAAVLSHRSAADVWELLPAPAGPADVDVLRLGRCGRRPAGIRVHETRVLEPRDVRRRHGLPLTSPARTLLDLSDVLTPRRLERALDEALARRLLTRSQLRDVVARASGRRGAKRLSELVEGGGSTRTRSEGEELILALCRRAELPAPCVNAVVEGFEVDFFWPGHGLVLEMDGWHWHSGRAAFERDRRKTAVLTAAGLRVMHGTWAQAQGEPFALVARVAQALSRPAPR